MIKAILHNAKKAATCSARYITFDGCLNCGAKYKYVLKDEYNKNAEAIEKALGRHNKKIIN